MESIRIFSYHEKALVKTSIKHFELRVCSFSRVSDSAKVAVIPNTFVTCRAQHSKALTAQISAESGRTVSYE